MSNLFSPEILQQLEELNLKVVTAEEWDKLQKVLYKNDHADKDKEIILAGKFDFEPNLSGMNISSRGKLEKSFRVSSTII
jgi:hypothetical protein